MLSGQVSDVHYPPEDYYIITCSPVLLSRHGCSVLYLAPGTKAAYEEAVSRR